MKSTRLLIAAVVISVQFRDAASRPASKAVSSASVAKSKSSKASLLSKGKSSSKSSKSPEHVEAPRKSKSAGNEAGRARSSKSRTTSAKAQASSKASAKASTKASAKAGKSAGNEAPSTPARAGKPKPKGDARKDPSPPSNASLGIEKASRSASKSSSSTSKSAKSLKSRTSSVKTQTSSKASKAKATGDDAKASKATGNKASHPSSKGGKPKLTGDGRKDPSPSSPSKSSSSRSASKRKRSPKPARKHHEGSEKNKTPTMVPTAALGTYGEYSLSPTMTGAPTRGMVYAAAKPGPVSAPSEWSSLPPTTMASTFLLPIIESGTQASINPTSELPEDRPPPTESQSGVLSPTSTTYYPTPSFFDDISDIMEPFDTLPPTSTTYYPTLSFVSSMDYVESEQDDGYYNGGGYASGYS